MEPMWQKLTKNDDMGDPTSFLDFVYSRSSGSMVAPVRTETNGRNANAVTTTKRKLLRYRPKEFGDIGSVVIDGRPYRSVGLGSRWTRFFGHVVRC